MSPSNNLILASTSVTRQQLLSRLQLPFSINHPHINERAVLEDDPEQLALKLSLLKAQAVAAQNAMAYVIGSDQVGICDGVILHKPETIENATAQLGFMTGKECVFYTAITVVNSQNKQVQQYCDVTKIAVRNLTHNEISRYLQKESPLFCAGSFMAEGLGISLFDKISSNDPTALLGLPLIELSKILRSFGFLTP